MHALSNVAGTPGTGVLEPGAWLPILIILNTLGVVALVGVAIYSGWQLWRSRAGKSDTRAGNLLLENVLILTGALFNAAAGTLARAFGLSSSFWLIMALGWIIFYLGVLFTGKRRRTASEAQSQGETKESAASA